MAAQDGEELRGLLQGLSEEVRSLVAPSPHVPRVQGPLAPLDFMRDFVAQNRPVVVEGALEHWPALRLWGAPGYLQQRMGGRHVHVDLTPHGRGDAVVSLEHPAQLLRRDSPGGADLAEEAIPGVGSRHGHAGPHGEAVGLENGGEETAPERECSMPAPERERPNVESCEAPNVCNEAEESTPKHWFATPLEARCTLDDFFRLLRESRWEPALGVPYVQHQNSSLTSDFSALAADVGAGIPFATAAFGGPADATNFWAGDERAETSWHKDHYENLYAVVEGEKHFRLLPPCDLPAMGVTDYPAAKYWRPEPLSGPFFLVPDSPPRSVPWASVDANLQLLPGLQGAGKPALLTCPKPIRCTLRKGDVLFLPAMWFHHVTQTPSAAGPTLAVNFCMRSPGSNCAVLPVHPLCRWARASSAAGSCAHLCRVLLLSFPGYDMAFDSRYAYFNMLDGITRLMGERRW